jgi:lysophospholipase L1-like esterase
LERPIPTKRLVFIGDSLTEWYDWDRRFPDCNVTNLGVSGEMVEEMLDRRALIRSRAGNPDFVFLMTGINNVLQERYAIAGPYREIVRTFTAWWKHTTIVIESLLPVNYAWIGNDIVRDINRRLQEIANEFGGRYLDVHAAFLAPGEETLPGLLSEDGVHLTSKGYEVWARSVEGFLLASS